MQPPVEDGAWLPTVEDIDYDFNILSACKILSARKFFLLAMSAPQRLIELFSSNSLPPSDARRAGLRRRGPPPSFLSLS